MFLSCEKTAIKVMEANSKSLGQRKEVNEEVENLWRSATTAASYASLLECGYNCFFKCILFKNILK